MKRRHHHCIGSLILCASVLITISGCDTESNTENPDLSYFIKYYGGDGNQYGVDMLSLDDGSFLLLGQYAETDFNRDVYLLRVNAEGSVIWENRIGENEPGVWSPKDIEPTNDGNFIVLSDFRKDLDNPRDSSDIRLLKISADGALLKTLSLGTPAHDYGRTVTPLSDGSFIVSGTTEFTSTFPLANNTDPDLGDVFNYRVTENIELDTEWSPVIVGFGAHMDVAVKTIETPTGFYVYGHTNSTLTGGLNPNRKLGLFYFGRQTSGTKALTNYPGNVQPLNNTEINFVQAVSPALGSGVLVVGTSQDNVGKSGIFVARMRSTLTFEPNNVANDATFYDIVHLGNNINLRGVAAATSLFGEQGFLILGNEVRGTGALNFWLSKIDQSGKLIWSTTFGSEAKDDTAGAVLELPDGKIVILATMGLADNQFKMAFVKVNGQGQFLK